MISRLPLARRRFLSAATAATAAVALAACSAGSTPAPPMPTSSSPPLPLPTPSPLAPPITTATVNPTPSVVTAATPMTYPAPPATVAWLRDHAIPLATTDATDDFADLQPLKALIGNARIVSLGEQTHGTHEFFTTKHRLVRFLVREMGFTTFAMEANLPEADRVDAYLQTGNGNPAHLLAGLYFWTWNTQEVRDMLQWLRAANAEAGSALPIRFRGFDCQFIGGAIEAVVTYLRVVDPDHAAAVQLRYALHDARPWAGDPVALLQTESPEAQIAYQGSVQAIYDDLLTARDPYRSRSAPEAYTAALQAARVVVQAVEIALAPGTTGAAIRDRSLAENVGWLLDQAGPGAKMIVWAHNGHIGTTPYGNNAPPVPPIKGMGMYLRERYGNALWTCGFAGAMGTFNAYTQHDPTLLIAGPMATHPLTAPPDDSYEAALQQTGIARLIVDLRPAASAAEAKWLAGPHPFRLIGALYADDHPEDFWYATRLPETFDTVIYLRDTTPSLLLPFA